MSSLIHRIRKSIFGGASIVLFKLYDYSAKNSEVSDNVSFSMNIGDVLLDMFLQIYTICSCLTQAMPTLHCSEYDSKAMTEIGELFKSMEARRPQLDAILSLFVGKIDPNAVVVTEEKDDDKISDSNLEDEDGKTEDSEVEPNTSKGKGKNKKKNKPKKGKGGKKK